MTTRQENEGVFPIDPSEEPWAPTTWGGRDGRSITFGRVAHVNGPDARETDFKPTLYELKVLTDHWATRIAEIEGIWDEHKQVGSTDLREHPYALSRLADLESHIGESEVEDRLRRARVAGGLHTERDDEAP